MRKLMAFLVVVSVFLLSIVSCGTDVIEEKATTYRVLMYIDSEAELNGIPRDLEVVMHWDGSLDFYVEGKACMAGTWSMKGTKVTVNAKGMDGKSIGGNARLTLNGGRLNLEVNE